MFVDRTLPIHLNTTLGLERNLHHGILEELGSYVQKQSSNGPNSALETLRWEQNKYSLM